MRLGKKYVPWLLVVVGIGLMLVGFATLAHGSACLTAIGVSILAMGLMLV